MSNILGTHRSGPAPIMIRSIHPSNEHCLFPLGICVFDIHQYWTRRMSLKQGLVSLISHITPLVYVVQKPPIGVHSRAY